MELILKAKDIRVEFKGRDVLDINELEVYDYRQEEMLWN
ncbi:ABC transporter [Streptococcus pneumoniae GA07643]|nr:ABC transporter [Streptococcus pneumoniae GA07643]